MQLAIEAPLGISNRPVLVTEIPSFAAGLIAFLFVFLLMGIMYYVLRTEREKTMPQLNPIGPSDIVRFENPLSNSDTPYLAIITLVTLELILDGLIVVSVLLGTGSIAVGTMLALAAFLAAAIIGIYRSAFMSDAFTRKPRLETIAASLLEKPSEGEGHE